MSEARQNRNRPPRRELLALRIGRFFTTYPDRITSVSTGTIAFIAVAAGATSVLLVVAALSLGFFTAFLLEGSPGTMPRLTLRLYDAHVALLLFLATACPALFLIVRLMEQLAALDRPAVPPSAGRRATIHPNATATIDDLRSYAAERRAEAARDFQGVTEAMDAMTEEIFSK